MSVGADGVAEARGPSEGPDLFEAPMGELPEALTVPKPGECLICYLWRMQDFGCRGHEFTDRYVELRAPGATGLRRRLAGMGAVCCECEVFLNAYQPIHRQWLEELAEDEWEYRMAETPDMPPCFGVRRGSTQPCGLWTRS